MKRLAATLLFVFACCHPRPPTPPPGTATCADYCNRLAQLKCPDAKPTAEGATCEAVCQNIQESGIVDLNLDCRIEAASCAAADACPSRELR